MGVKWANSISGCYLKEGEEDVKQTLPTVLVRLSLHLDKQLVL